MDEQEFWNIVQRAHDESRGDMDKKCALIKGLVSGLQKEKAVAFSDIFDAMMDRAYRWPLWAAAYIINGGCGDDTFADFRATLISRGREAFEVAVDDPEELADRYSPTEDWFCEGYQYAVHDGTKAAAGFLPKRRPHPAEPAGEPWDEADVGKLFPKLANKFG